MRLPGQTAPHRSSFAWVLPALLLLACGNSDSAPPASYEPVIEDIDAEVDPVEADGDAGARPTIPPDPTPIGGGRDASQDMLDAGTDAGAAPDARAPVELAAYTSVERLLVADGKSARVHAIDVPTRERLDTIVLNGSGPIHASADGRHAYVLQTAQNQVQVLSMGLSEVSDTEPPVLSAPSLLRATLSGFGPTAFASFADQVAILYAGASELQTFDGAALATAMPTHRANLQSALEREAVLVHLGDRVIASEPGQSALRVFDERLARASDPELECADAAGSAQAGPRLAIGCSDGVLLWSRTQAGTSTRLVRYPSSAGTERARRLKANPSVQSFLTTLGAQLCVLGVDGEFRCVAAPADLIDYAFDASGKRALVLSRDGYLHIFDGENLAPRDRMSLFIPILPGTPELELPGLAVGRRLTYVSDPSGGYVHILDTTSAQSVGRLDVAGGFPTRITVFKYAL